MRFKGTRRATPVSALICQFRMGIGMTVLLTIITVLAMPIDVLAYDEAMAEIVICSDPGVIIQNQSYRTSTRQTLFHTANNALTDTEAFGFSGFWPAGIQLAQTTAATAVGSETGFFTSTASSDIVPPVHIGGGFLGTWIGDPLLTGAPIFAGLTFPHMTKTDTSALAAMPKGLNPAVAETEGSATGNKSAAIPQPSGQPVAKNATDTSGNAAKMDAAVFRPVINNALNDTLANQSARNATAATGAKAANATKNESETSATPKPSPIPSPAIRPGEPFYHQQNKPFSTALTSPSGPYKSTPAKIQNTSGFDRFLMNTVGRSTTDKAFNGTTSSPTYITPDKALAVQIPYDFIQGGRGMTMPGTHLNYRAWPL